MNIVVQVKKGLTAVKAKFGIYEIDQEYQIPLKSITIQDNFKKTRIRENKWRNKWKYYKTNKKFESQIKVTKDLILVDGYSSYKIANILHIPSVPVVIVADKVIN